MPGQPAATLCLLTHGWWHLEAGVADGRYTSIAKSGTQEMACMEMDTAVLW